jgi:ATPase subunit of ABC transporter with duplicated ATPase domains
VALEFERVSFSYDGAASPVVSRVSLHCGRGWTGIVGANGAGKTTLLRLALGELSPGEGVVRRPGLIAHCPQRADVPSREVRDFVASSDAQACRLRGVFGVSSEWPTRWDTLSHGERKRAQIALALWTGPEALLLDEPTNHIDEAARRLLLAGLQLFRGIGLLVSHDRELLDALCGQCAFLDPPSLVVRPGTYSEAARTYHDEERSRQKHRNEASSELARLRREAARRGRAAAGADHRRSKRGLAKGDSDGRERVDRARATGADGRAGALFRQMESRILRAEQRVDGLGLRKTYDLGIRLPGTPSPRSRLLALPAGHVAMADGRLIEHPALSVAPDDRIALRGPNGSGKTTLVRHLLTVLNLERQRTVYLPQEVDLETSRAILHGFHALPRARQGEVLTIVSALGSRPERLLASQEASPGEIRKLLLALGAVNDPHLVVMDEPTNHLDLPAIECLEDALAGCGAALLLVSHDRRFLQRLAAVQWVLTPTGGGSRLDVD